MSGLWVGTRLDPGRLIRAFVLWTVDQRCFPDLSERQTLRAHPALRLGESLHFTEAPGDACVHNVLGRAGLEDALQGSTLEMRTTPPLGRRGRTQKRRSQVGAELGGCNGGAWCGHPDRGGESKRAFLSWAQGKGVPPSAGLGGKVDEVCSLIQVFFAQSPTLIIIL